MSVDRETVDERLWYVRLTGMPYEVTVEQILEFLQGVIVDGGAEGIKITKRASGRPSGECIVKLATHDDLERALGLSRNRMGSRFVLVLPSSKFQFNMGLTVEPPEAVLRIRGLHHGTNPEQIKQFFHGIHIARKGIILVEDRKGRLTGEAYVEFATLREAEKAFKLDHTNMGSRSYAEMDDYARRVDYNGGYFDNSSYRRDSRHSHQGYRSDPYYRDHFESYDDRYRNYRRIDYRDQYSDREFSKKKEIGYGKRDDFNQYSRYEVRDYDNNSQFHYIRASGLPYKSTKKDIRDFFHPDVPCHIEVLMNSDGRHSGMADVYFTSHDACLRAMDKDRGFIGDRFIVLKMFSDENIPPTNPNEIYRIFGYDASVEYEETPVKEHRNISNVMNNEFRSTIETNQGYNKEDTQSFQPSAPYQSTLTFPNNQTIHQNYIPQMMNAVENIPVADIPNLETRNELIQIDYPPQSLQFYQPMSEKDMIMMQQQTGGLNSSSGFDMKFNDMNFHQPIIPTPRENQVPISTNSYVPYPPFTQSMNTVHAINNSDIQGNVITGQRYSNVNHNKPY